MEETTESNDENLNENNHEEVEINTESDGDDATTKLEPIESYIEFMGEQIIENVIYFKYKCLLCKEPEMFNRPFSRGLSSYFWFFERTKSTEPY